MSGKISNKSMGLFELYISFSMGNLSKLNLRVDFPFLLCTWLQLQHNPSCCVDAQNEPLMAYVHHLSYVHSNCDSETVKAYSLSHWVWHYDSPQY